MNSKIKLAFKILIAIFKALFDVFDEPETGAGKEETTSKEPEETQKFYFPMKYLRITQKDLSSPSHQGSWAMDFGGKDSGKDILYAPCDLIVKRVREKANGEIYFESLFPVLFADGTTDYAHLLLLHDNNTYKLKEGQVIKQGEPFYKEGGMYNNNPNYYDAHVHIEAGKGKWKSCVQFKNEVGTYVSENLSPLYHLFWLKKDTVNLNDTEHLFKYEP